MSGKGLAGRGCGVIRQYRRDSRLRGKDGKEIQPLHPLILNLLKDGEDGCCRRLPGNRGPSGLPFRKGCGTLPGKLGKEGFAAYV